MSSGHVDTTIKTVVQNNTVFDAVLDATAIFNWRAEIAAKIDGNYDEAHADYLASIGLYRQSLINSNFDVWQRGTSLASGGYLADRWLFNTAGGGTVTQSRQAFTAGQTSVPNEPTYFYRAAITVAFTSSNLTQKIEDVRYRAAQTVTVSFWAKADAPKTLTITVVQEFGSGGSASVSTVAGVANLTTIWQLFTFTVTLPSISGKTIGTGSSLSPVLTTGTQTGTFDISQAQVNAGNTALPFQPRSFAEELTKCQRYYEKNYGYAGYAGSGNQSNMSVFLAGTTSLLFGNTRYAVPKRITPTITIYSFNGTTSKVAAINSATDVGTAVTIVAGNSNEKGFSELSDSGAGLSAGTNYWFNWVADAEI